jgi:hypothetical protein
VLARPCFGSLVEGGYEPVDAVRFGSTIHIAAIGEWL